MDDKSIDPQIEVLEAKLKITEHELNVAIERAERAETELQNTLSENNASMQTDNDVFGNGEEEVVMRRKMTNGNQIVMPPPPPPPPVPNLNLGANKTEIKIKTQASAVAEMAAMLDIKPVNDTPAKTKNDNGGIYENNIYKRIFLGLFDLQKNLGSNEISLAGYQIQSKSVQNIFLL